MVAVHDKDGNRLMPCTQKRARLLLERGQARARWIGGVFYIQLLKEPSARECQKVVVGIDTGSMRESYTVATKNGVVININTNTPYWVKKKIANRKALRRGRRYRKTPYRKCRLNRKKKNWLAPSTKARWQTKIRIVSFLMKLFPITAIGIEDIKAETKEDDKKWNQSFSPLEVGKKWCYEELQKLVPCFYTFAGYDNKKHRDVRGFIKIKEKLKPVWEAHCVDSHVMCEQLLNTEIEPFKGFHYFEFFQWHRRQLHHEQIKKGGARRQYGTTITAGKPRGTLLRHKKYGLCYLGGYRKGGASLHNMQGLRIARDVKIEDCKFLCILKWKLNER